MIFFCGDQEALSTFTKFVGFLYLYYRGVGICIVRCVIGHTQNSESG